MVYDRAIADGSRYTLVRFQVNSRIRSSGLVPLYTDLIISQALPIHGRRERPRRHVLLLSSDPHCTRATAARHSDRWQLHSLRTLVDGVD